MASYCTALSPSGIRQYRCAKLGSFSHVIAHSGFGFILRGDDTKGTRVGIRPGEGKLFVDRRESGRTDFHQSFPSIDTAPLRTTAGSYHLTIFVDHCSVEVFAQDGQVTMTELIFPAETSTDLSVYATGGTATIGSLQVTKLA